MTRTTEDRFGPQCDLAHPPVHEHKPRTVHGTLGRVLDGEVCACQRVAWVEWPRVGRRFAYVVGSTGKRHETREVCAVGSAVRAVESGTQRFRCATVWYELTKDNGA